MTQQWIPKKPNFGPPPSGYIPGIGRGAIGFSTRGDIGPANIPGNIKNVELDQAQYADMKYDQWQGYKAPLFGKEGLDQQDKQAQDAYDFCQRKMDQRREKQRQQKLNKEKEKIKKQTVSFKEQFADLKRDLGKISYEQWENIPEAKSIVSKTHKQKYTPVPDSMIISLLASNTTNKVAQPETNKDFRDAKEILLRSGLEKAENSVLGKSYFDKIGYLTELSTKKIQSDFLGDVKRARVLLKSALNSNPKNADLWISAARVQQLDGKIQEARQMLKKGLQSCSQSQDLWIQTARMQKAELATSILVDGLKYLPKSEKLWLAVSKLQNSNKEMKSKILRKGLQNLPQSVALWKQIIELQDLQQAKKLLYKAVECLPKQIDLWLALARTQNYESAKQVINKARKANPLNVAIWINAAKLQQTQQDDKKKVKQKIEKILSKGRQILKKNGNSVSRDQWIEQALICQRSQNYMTCQMLIKISVNLGLSQEEYMNVFIKDTQLFEKQRQSIFTTRFLYKYGVIQTKDKFLLQKMIEFQRRMQLQDKNSDIKGAIKLGIQLFGKDSQFWCLMIQKFINEGDLQSAQNIIQKASESLQQLQRQDVLLKKVYIMKIKKQYTQARMQLQILRNVHQSQQTFIQSIKFQYQMKQYAKAWQICQEAFKKLKNQDIFIFAFNIKQKIGTYEQCKTLIQNGLQHFSKSIRLWVAYIQYEISMNRIGKARAIIDKALIKIPSSQELYLQSVQLQINHGSKKQANFSLAKALKACPKNGQLWGYSIELEATQTRKKKASVAIQNCPQNPYILCSIAKTFWKQNKLDKAKKWLQNAVQLDLTNGEIWSYYYKFISQKFPVEMTQTLHKFKTIGQMKSGRKWIKVVESQQGWSLTAQQILLRLVNSIGDQLSRIN